MGKPKTVINPGDTFENKYWKIIKELDTRGRNRFFLCECLLCGNEYEVGLNSLINKNTCFCCRPCSISIRQENKAAELIGKVFGRLTVISKHSVENGHLKYLCKCECGNEKIIVGSNLKNGKTTSCGCYNKERAIEANSGENNHFWKGGISNKYDVDRARINTHINPIIRERDNYTCQKCGDNKGGNLNCHHIFDFSTYPELKFEPYNLITLCEDCHVRNFHKIHSNRSTNTLENLENWMGEEYKYRNELLEKYNEYYYN